MKIFSPKSMYAASAYKPHTQNYTTLLVGLRKRNLIAVNKAKNKKVCSKLACTYFMNSPLLLVGIHY
jgi:hypothetical protein